jgi:membrane protein
VRIPGLRQLGAWGVLKELFRRWTDHVIPDKAAQLSYYFLFALFPFLVFLVTLLAYLPVQGATEELVTRVAQIMPAQAANILRHQVNRLTMVQRPRLLTVGIIFTLWSASRGVDAIRTALNLAYDVKESRPFWKTQGMAVAVTVITAILVPLAVAAFALGGTAGEWLADHLGVARWYALIWAWLRWPIIALVLMFVVAVLYFALPDVKQEWRFITPGSVTGTLLWLAATYGFTQYAEHFGKYNVTYGSIGGVIVLMTWLYITGIVFIIGGEVNAALEHASHDGKAPGAHAAGEAPPPPEARPSAAAPGATKSKESAKRTHLGFLWRKRRERAAAQPYGHDGQGE